MNKCLISLMAGTAFATAFATVPELSDVTLTQTGGKVTITYTLANGPAVVTADILTNAVNAAEGVSIGARNFWNLDGDVNRLITEDGPHTITWKPARSWPNHLIDDGSVRAKLTAWETAFPPPYMVFELKKKNIQYYESEDALPGGLHENPEYKLTKVVMKRIDAAEKSIVIGSANELGAQDNEQTFPVKFDANYYIGVFEVTLGQWAQYQPTASNGFNIESAFRPMAMKGMSQIRWSCLWETWDNDGDAGDWPNPPRGWNDPDVTYASFLGRIWVDAGVEVDLPTAAQWEYAARGGFGPGYWGDGSPIIATETDANLDKLGRYKHNGGEVSDAYPANQGVAQADWTSANGSAVVGSYRPNGYGLYDMHGNVWEWILDWYYADQEPFGGALPSVPSDGSRLCSIRGGSFNEDAWECRAARRGGKYGRDIYKDIYTGFRLAAPCIAK